MTVCKEKTETIERAKISWVIGGCMKGKGCIIGKRIPKKQQKERKKKKKKTKRGYKNIRKVIIKIFMII